MDLKPWQTALLLTVFVSLIGGAVWAGGKWREFQSPTLMRTDQQGNLYINARQHLFVFDERGRYQRDIDLQQWGIETLTGGFAFFSNGDILLRTGNAEHNLVDSIASFFRIERFRQSSDEQALMRCNTVSMQCAALPDDTRKYGDTFRLDISSGDEIFVADTGRDRLYWLGERGNLIDQVGEGLRFPNKIQLVEGALLVANTNFNEITRIPLADGHFAATAQWQHIGMPQAARNSGHVWPSDVLPVDEQWFVLSHGNNMMDGTVYRMDANGDNATAFQMPEGSDVLSLAYLKQDILLTDFANLKVYRYTQAGNLLGELSAPALDAFLTEQKAQQQYYRDLSRKFWWAFAGVFVLVFVFALVQENEKKIHEEWKPVSENLPAAMMVQTEKPDVTDAGIRWYRVKRSLLLLYVCLPLLFLMIALVQVFAMAGAMRGFDGGLWQTLWQNQRSALLMSAFPLLLLPVMLIRVVRWRRWALGVKNEWLIWNNGRAVVMARMADVRRVMNNGLAIGNQLVPVGMDKRRSLFEPALWDEVLTPSLPAVVKFSYWQSLQWQWQHQRGRLIWLLVLLALLLLLHFGIAPSH